MGRDIDIGGETCFYVVGWNAAHFEPFHGQTVSQAVGMVLQSMSRINERIVAKNISISAPPNAKAQVGGLGASRDSNWWFGVDLSADEKLSVTFHTLLNFFDVLLIRSGEGLGSQKIQVEGCFIPEDPEDPEDPEKFS